MARTKGNIRKRGDTGRYEVNYLDAAGQRRWKTFETKRAAEAFLRRERGEVDAVRAGLKPMLVVDRQWDDLVEHWKVKKAAKRSLNDDKIRIKKHLDPVLGGVSLTEIGRPMVTLLEGALARKVKRKRLSATTARKALILFGSMMRLAVREGWAKQVPVVELPKEPQRDYEWIKTAADMKKLIEAARAEEYPGLPELYATALYTGLRAGELFGLRWSDVDLDRQVLTVQRSYDTPTKNNRVRRVPIPNPLKRMLEAWRGKCHSATLVFPNLRGNMQAPSARVMRGMFFRCLKRAELPRITFHGLRHSFASHYMLEGGDIYRLQRIMGHSSVKVTQRYAHLSPEAFRGDRDRLPDFL